MNWIHSSDCNPLLASNCPNCKRTFPSMATMLAHLNSALDSCWRKPTVSSRGDYPFPPALRAFQSHNCTAQYHSTSGYIYGTGKNTLQRIQDDKYNEKREINMYWPFPNHGEWSLGKFLTENLTQTQINAYLKLAWISAVSLSDLALILYGH